MRRQAQQSTKQRIRKTSKGWQRTQNSDLFKFERKTGKPQEVALPKVRSQTSMSSHSSCHITTGATSVLIHTMKTQVTTILNEKNQTNKNPNPEHSHAL